MLIDVSPAGLGVDEVGVQNAISRAIFHSPGRLTPQGAQRFDADGPIGSGDALDVWQAHVDGLIWDEIEQNHGAVPEHLIDFEGRADAGFTGGSGGFPRSFEHIRSRILDEKRRPLNGMRLFALDLEVPLGAKKHTSRRRVGKGTARIHRGGNTGFGVANTGFVEETFGVAYVTCAVSTNFFEMLTTDWAGIRQYQNDMRQAMRLVEERMNRIIWYGDARANLKGVLNYPHLRAYVLPVTFNDAESPQAIVQALHDLCNDAWIRSGGTFQPNVLAVSPRIHRFLTTRVHKPDGGSDLTIAEFFLKGQDMANGIKRIESAQELAGIGPAGEDGLFAYADEKDSVSHVLIQPPSSLPVYQSSPIETQTVIFAATGGMVMGDVGNNTLGYGRLS